LIRYGGDEFALLFLDTDEQGAWVAMQHLAEQADVFNLTSGKPWQLNFSWGVSEYDHDRNPDMTSWIASADEKMYAMKEKNEHKNG
ncbi:diguanylate cyclase, partial [Pseudescherichia sp.]|uniref:diguanylate cyclase n=1 Tax=Pseudescherichia sp. TaxID=2055881 RepID=UPI0028AD70B4